MIRSKNKNDRSKFYQEELNHEISFKFVCINLKKLATWKMKKDKSSLFFIVNIF